MIEYDTLGAAGPYHSAKDAADVMYPGAPNATGVGALPVSVGLTRPVTTPPIPLSKSGLVLPGTSGPGMKSRTVPVRVMSTANAVDAASERTVSARSFFMVPPSVVRGS